MRFCLLTLGFVLLRAILYGQQPRLVLPIGHTSQVYTAKFSPDNKKVITTSSDKTSKLWDVRTGRLLAELKGHRHSVVYAEFSPKGERIVTCSWDNTAKVWSALDGKLMFELTGHTQWLLGARFSPDGSKILTHGNDGKVKLWDATTGKQEVDFEIGTDDVNTAQFSPDGKNILVSNWQGAGIWNIASKKLIIQLLDHSEEVRSAQYSPDGKKIVTGSEDATAKIWDANTGLMLLNLPGHSMGVVCVEFSPDGSQVLTGEWQNVVKVWDAKNGMLLHSLRTDDGWLGSAHFSPDGRKIVTAAKSSKVWEVATGKLLFEIDGHRNLIASAEFSTDGKRIATASWDETAKTWDANTGSLINDLTGNVTNMSNPVFNPKNNSQLSFDRYNMVVWDLEKGKIIANVNGHKTSYSPDGTRFVTTGILNETIVWRVSDGKKLFSLGDSTIGSESVKYSPDGTTIGMICNDSTVKIWNSNDGKLIANLAENKNWLSSIDFSADGKLIATHDLNKVIIWSTNNGKLITEIGSPGINFNSAQFSPNGESLLTSSGSVITGGENGAQIWDTYSGKRIFQYEGHNTITKSANFSYDGKKVVTSSDNSFTHIWDAASGQLLFNFSGEVRGLSADNQLVLIVDHGNAMLWDIENSRPLTNLSGNSNDFVDVSISPDKKKIITTTTEQTANCWDAESGKLLFTFFGEDPDKTFVKTPSGHYFSTKEIIKKLHYVTSDLKIIAFEQLDVKYNRPDKVLEEIGSADEVLIKSYRKAWEKRIRKLGVDTTQFRDDYNVPECDFANRDEIEYEQNHGSLALRIEGIDSAYKLDRFNIWINGSPIFGQRGIRIRQNNMNFLDTVITIQLSQGENRIETSITNVNGTESYRMPLLVHYNPSIKQKESLRFIGIGIDRFADSKHDLQYSSKDIRELAIQLKEKYKDEITVDTLFNEKVTIENVKRLKSKLLQTSVNDKVIISYSGHGLLSEDFDYYLSTYSVNFEKPDENGLLYDELENLLDSIPARKKLLLIDACHSGEVDKDDLVRLEGVNSHGVKGLKPVAYKKEGQLGLQNSFELMQSLFVNVSKGTGATVISAAAGTQFALERGDLKNGVFTYSILEVLDKYPTIKISELRRLVGERVEQLTNGAQKPTSRSEPVASDWEL
jgi:WD40 repeat protein